MVKKTILLSMLSLCASIHTSAQSADGYVYVTDDITLADLSNNSSVIRSGTFTRNNTTYNYRINYTDQAFTKVQTDDYLAIVTKSTEEPSAFLKSVTIGWTNEAKIDAGIEILGSNIQYDKQVDILDTEYSNDGVKIGEISYLNATSNSSTLEFEPQYRYFGIRKLNQKVTRFASLSITWQLIYNRANLTLGNLGTLCLPYSIKAEDMEDITAYTISGKVVENGEVTSIVFNLADHIEAGKPYLFVANSEEIFLKYSGNKADAPICEKGMYGVYERHPFADDSNFNEYDYYVITKNNTIQRASIASGVNANCAFIKMDEVPEYSPAQSNGRNLILTSEGFTQTDIAPTLLNSLQSPNSSSTTIDLSGRRITNVAAPTITVHNGKKILSK